MVFELIVGRFLPRRSASLSLPIETDRPHQRRIVSIRYRQLRFLTAGQALTDASLVEPSGIAPESGPAIRHLRFDPKVSATTMFVVYTSLHSLSRNFWKKVTYGRVPGFQPAAEAI